MRNDHKERKLIVETPPPKLLSSHRDGLFMDQKPPFRTVFRFLVCAILQFVLLDQARAGEASGLRVRIAGFPESCYIGDVFYVRIEIENTTTHDISLREFNIPTSIDASWVKFVRVEEKKTAAAQCSLLVGPYRSSRQGNSLRKIPSRTTYSRTLLLRALYGTPDNTIQVISGFRESDLGKKLSVPMQLGVRIKVELWPEWFTTNRSGSAEINTVRQVAYESMSQVHRVEFRDAVVDSTLIDSVSVLETLHGDECMQDSNISVLRSRRFQLNPQQDHPSAPVFSNDFPFDTKLAERFRNDIREDSNIARLLAFSDRFQHIYEKHRGSENELVGALEDLTGEMSQLEKEWICERISRVLVDRGLRDAGHQFMRRIGLLSRFSY